MEVPQSEFRERLEKVRQHLRTIECNALCLFSSVRIFYLTGFAFIPTERPLALVVPTEKEPFSLVPSLEEEHIAGNKSLIPRVYAYPEYPGTKHPMLYLREAMEQEKVQAGRIAVDSDGYGSLWGYQGSSLSSLLSEAVIVNVREWLVEMSRVKSPQEISLLGESAKLGNLAHGMLQSRMQIGRPEIEISQDAARETTQVMLKMFGSNYVSKRWNASPAFAYMISGPKTSLPHALPSGRKLQRGDGIITSCSAEVGGYMAEMERTLFVGEPTAQQAKYFEIMRQAREEAFNVIAPGRRCSDVDKTVSEFLKSAGCSHLARHHVGHAMGLEPHEAPFLDQGDDTLLEPGMVFSIEPGLYVDGLGGFRHSDTIVVTQTGMERITYYPTDIEFLTLEI